MGWISVRQARQRLGNAVGWKFVASLARRGKVLASEVEGRILIDEDSLDDLIAKGRVDVLVPRERRGKPLPPSRHYPRSA